MVEMLGILREKIRKDRDYPINDAREIGAGNSIYGFFGAFLIEDDLLRGY